MSFSLTRMASAVFDPITSGGQPRGADMAEVRLWGTEIEKIVLQGAPFSSRASIASVAIPMAIQKISCQGFAELGDCMPFIMSRISVPTTPGLEHSQDASGAWWMITSDTVQFEMFGAKGDVQSDAGGSYVIGTGTPDDAAIDAAVRYARDRFATIRIRPRGYRCTADKLFDLSSSSLFASDIGTGMTIEGMGIDHSVFVFDPGFALHIADKNVDDAQQFFGRFVGFSGLGSAAKPIVRIGTIGDAPIVVCNGSTTTFAYNFKANVLTNLALMIHYVDGSVNVIRSGFTATGLGNTSGGVITYNPGTPLPNGTRVQPIYSGATELNLIYFSQIQGKNNSTAPGAVGLQIENCFQMKFDQVIGNANRAAGSSGFVVKNSPFCNFQSCGGANAEYGLVIDGAFNYGQVWTAPDFEEALIAYECRDPAAEVTLVGGTFVYRDSAGIGLNCLNGRTIIKGKLNVSPSQGASILNQIGANVGLTADEWDAPIPAGQAVLAPMSYTPQPNLIDNANWSINQLGVAAGTYPAGAHIVDMWKAGSSGCVIAWNAAKALLQITSGSVVQIMEADFLNPDSEFSGADLTISAEGLNRALPISIAGVTKSLPSNFGRRTAVTFRLPVSGISDIVIEIGPVTAATDLYKLSMNDRQVAGAWSRPDRAVEFTKALRRLQRSKPYGIPETTQVFDPRVAGRAVGDGRFTHHIQLTPMRANPTVTIRSVGNNTTGNVSRGGTTGATLTTDAPATVVSAGQTGFFVESNAVVTANEMVAFHWIADARM